MIEKYQQEFIEFALSIKALRFGEFTLKSGRLSPYFFNTGLFNTGKSLAQLAKYYAATLNSSKLNFDVIYGPAYKGIPLAAATSIALATEFNLDKAYSFNRKEAKKHGEGGSIVGSELKGKVLIIDDVISAGTSIRESVDVIKSQGAEVAGVIISVDRQERGEGDLSAIQEVEQEYGIEVLSIIKLEHLIHYIAHIPVDTDSTNEVKRYYAAIESYKAQWGI